MAPEIACEMGTSPMLHNISKAIIRPTRTLGVRVWIQAIKGSDPAGDAGDEHHQARGYMIGDGAAEEQKGRPIKIAGTVLVMVPPTLP